MDIYHDQELRERLRESIRREQLEWQEECRQMRARHIQLTEENDPVAQELLRELDGSLERVREYDRQITNLLERSQETSGGESRRPTNDSLGG